MRERREAREGEGGGRRRTYGAWSSLRADGTCWLRCTRRTLARTRRNRGRSYTWLKEEAFEISSYRESAGISRYTRTIGSSYMPSVSANFPSRCIIVLLWALSKSPADLTLLYQREKILRKFINNRRDAKYI